MMIDNPFFHRGAIRRPEEFHGRGAEISQILGLLRNGQSVSLIGPRRIGKSSMLLHLARPQTRRASNLEPPHALFVLLDCQEFGGSPPEEVYEALLTELLARAERAGIDVGPVERFGTYRSLDRVLNKMVRPTTVPQDLVGLVAVLNQERGTDQDDDQRGEHERDERLDEGEASRPQGHQTSDRYEVAW